MVVGSIVVKSVTEPTRQLHTDKPSKSSDQGSELGREGPLESMQGTGAHAPVVAKHDAMRLVPDRRPSLYLGIPGERPRAYACRCPTCNLK